MNNLRYQYFVILLLCGLNACQMDAVGLSLSPAWKSKSIIVWGHAGPDMMALSPTGRFLFISCRNEHIPQEPSLALLDLSNNRHEILIRGLMRADGLKFAPDGSLWVGEDAPDGRIWRISEPEKLPSEQKIDRKNIRTSHPSIADLRAAGRFAHAGIAFGRNGLYAYLADAWNQGALYRLGLKDMHLQVLDKDGRWLNITHYMEARTQARLLQARSFNRIRDMESLPDGRILMSETGTGHIWALTDRKGNPAIVDEYLHDSHLRYPEHLAWDSGRHWLWITEDRVPSVLWAWDGKKLLRIASHADAIIAGVLPVHNDVYINLRNRNNGLELTLRLREHHNTDRP